jgi:hypothetical protein
LVLERKDILAYSTTWMNLEDIILNERNQSQKDKYFIIPLCRTPGIAPYRETEHKMVVIGTGKGETGNCLRGMEFHFYKFKGIL